MFPIILLRLPHAILILYLFQLVPLIVSPHNSPMAHLQISHTTFPPAPGVRYDRQLLEQD